MVTAATLHKERLFDDAQKLTLLENHLLTLAKKYSWQLRRGRFLPITITSWLAACPKR